MPSCSAGVGCRVDATWAAKGRFRTRSGIWNQAALRQKGAGSAPRRFGVRDVALCADGATYYESQAPGFALDGGYRIADEIDAMSVRTRIDATYDRAAEAIRQAFPSVKVGMVIVGLEVPHCHIHLSPIDHIGDLNFENQNFQARPEDLDAAAEAIRSAMAGT